MLGLASREEKRAYEWGRYKSHTKGTKMQ